jgi:pimeloyl-ACP methyl ester carboxylesterase
LALALTAVGLMLAVPAGAEAKLRFHDCEGDARCAVLTVPLDHSGAVPGRLLLRVRRQVTDSRAGIPLTLVLAGGPGYASATVPEHAWEAFGRDTLFLDQRGTGAGALRCRDLEAATATDAGREAAACATLLGDRRGFFRTSDTVEDIEALRTELGIDRLTIVGSGYGAYVAQRFALSHPDHVERLLLDSPVDAAGLDPLYVDSVAAARRVLPALCRSACQGFTRDVLADTSRLVKRLAAAPLRGTIVGPTGHRRSATLTRQELLYVLLSGDDDFLTTPEYPAAVWSALRGDAAPILRLKRRATAHPLKLRPRIASVATYAATLCEEVRFPWSWHATAEERDAAAFETEMAMDPGLAAPFDPGTLVRSDLMRLCRRWPTASPGPPADPGPMPDVPVLVLSSPESTRYSLETARRTAARFPHGKLLETPGMTPPFGFAGAVCVAVASERFLNGERVPKRCPRSSPGVRPFPPVPRSLGDLRPVKGVPGRRGRLLHALGATFGDLVDSFYADAILNLGPQFFEAGLRAGGLRGGSFAITENTFSLKRYEYVPGVRLTSRWKNGARVIGPVLIDGPGSLNGVVRLKEGPRDLSFLVRGRIAGRRVRAKVRVETRLAEAFSQTDEGGGSAPAAAVGGLLR